MISKQQQFETLVVALHALEYEIQDEKFLAEAISYACKTSSKNCADAIEEAKKIMSHLKKIDTKIEKASKDYMFERISSIEKSIIRVGIYMSTEKNLQKAISISECIRLTKKFGNPKASNFVHAILDSAI